MPLNVAHTILIGLVALGAALFFGLFHPAQNILVKRASSLALLIIGVLFLYHGLVRPGALAPQAVHSIAQTCIASAASPVEVHDESAMVA